MSDKISDAELFRKLEAVGCQVIEDEDEGEFILINTTRGSQTLLESEDYSSALFEAWSLVKD